MKLKLLPSLFCQISGVLLLVSVCQSAEPPLKPIEPFGGLKWTDGIVQTIKKVNKMDGIEKLDAAGINSVGNSQAPHASLKGLDNDSEIISALAGLMQGDSLVQDSVATKTRMVRRQLALGIENGITAEPIFLKGVTFRMVLKFFSRAEVSLSHALKLFSQPSSKRMTEKHQVVLSKFKPHAHLH